MLNIYMEELVPKLLTTPSFWDVLVNKLNREDNTFGTVIKLKELFDHNVITLMNSIKRKRNY